MASAPWRAVRRAEAAVAGGGCVTSAFEAAAYRALNPDLDLESDAAALQHFLARGMAEVRPCSFAHQFSPGFYRAYYPRLAGFSDEEAYRDWLTLGRREGRLSSETALMRSLGLTSDRMPEAFSAAAYRAEHADLRALSDPQAFEHFVRYGCRERRRPPLFGEAGADFLRKLAELYTVANEPGVAGWCYDKALALDPANAAAWRGYGDLQLDSGLNFMASTLYAGADAALPDQLWTLVNRGVASERLGDLDQAVACYKRAAVAHPGQAFVRARLRAAASTRFHIIWGRSNHCAAEGDAAGARAMLRDAVADYLAAVDDRSGPTPPLRRRDSRPPRVAILASDALPQCLHYRVLQKVEHLEAAGVEADWWPYGQADAFRRALHGFDVALFYRVPATPDVLDAMLHARRLGLATVYEIDDLIFDEANYPPPLESFRGLVSADEYPGLVTGATLFQEAMRLCDYGLTSTPPLQAAIAALVRERRCLLHRNGMGEAHHRVAEAAAPSRAAAAGQVTAFFGSGGRSHNENFDAVAPAIAAVMARRPELRLKVMGPLTLGPELQPFSGRIERVPFTADTVSYWRELAGADINLAPLTPGLFNDSKSEIKWLEAAMLGVPSLVSGSVVYREALQDGVDGCIANGVAQWSEQLDRLVADAGLRRRIGQAAREHALEHYGLKAMAESARSVVETVWRLHRRGPPARRKPRLVLVNVYFAPQTIGGATRLVEDNVQELQRRYGRDFELEVFCAREGGVTPGELERYSWNGVGVTALTPCPASTETPEASAGNARAFREYLDACRPDLIHFHAMQTLTASLLDEARAAGVPYVVTPHDGWWISDHQFLLDESGRPVPETGEWGDAARRERLLDALNGAEAVLAVSRSFGELLRERKIPKVLDCFNGLAPTDAVPPPPTGPKVRLGLLGGLGVAKGAELLRTALSSAHFPNLTFVVVDHLAPPFSRRHEFWGDNAVELLGKTPQAEVARLYGELNVLLAPSMCIESFGLVAREALSHNRWVVASDRGAIGDDVSRGENGWVIDVSDPANLIGVLREIDADPARYLAPTRRGAALRTSAEQADELAVLYNRLLDRGLERAVAAKATLEGGSRMQRASVG